MLPRLKTPHSPADAWPRVGTATDFHRFAADSTGTADDRPLMLAGIEWPGEPALLGHSDGDAAAHALVDAMLVAAGLGDIGSNFGTDRPEWAGAYGATFLTETRRILREAGWRLGNATVQVIGNRPRMGNRYTECSKALSEATGGPVTVSATTSDGMGFTGRGEGVAAIATALIIPL